MSDYPTITIDGRKRGIHIVIAERAIGGPLPEGAEVHHVDRNKKNNAPDNLVVCPSHAYHLLLHRRQRALDACGNANYVLCVYCGTYESQDRLKRQARGNKSHHYHVVCKAAYDRARNSAKAEAS